MAQAQAEADVLFPQLKAAHHEWWSDYTSTITGLKEFVSGKLRRSLIVLWCAVGLIMLIVCVNLSNLLLARAAARSKEFAMRSALGAGRGRIVRQLLTESLLLSSAGALLGLGFAFALTTYLAHQGSIALPLLSSVSVDGTALAWTVLIADRGGHSLRPRARNQNIVRQSAGCAEGHRPRNERRAEARAHARCTGDLRTGVGLRAADWRRFAAAEFSQSFGRGSGLPAKPGGRDQGGLRRWERPGTTGRHSSGDGAEHRSDSGHRICRRLRHAAVGAQSKLGIFSARGRCIPKRRISAPSFAS